MPLCTLRLRRPPPGLPALAAGLVATLVAVAPVPALASGMPQLDFANPLTLDQVWWGTGIFIVFLLLAWRWGLPQVANVLEERATSIAADLDAARAAKGDADRASAEVASATAAARTEAQGAINAAVDVAKQKAAAQAAALNARLEAQLQQAESQIGAARAAALGALRQVATDAAGTVVARLTGSLADPTRLDRAVTAALAARGTGATAAGRQGA